MHNASATASEPVSIDAEIFQLNAQALSAAIRTGRWRARTVTEAYIQRLERVNPKLNAVVVPLIEAARERALALDRLQAAGGWAGPLHGVPVTIKECYDYRGTATTAGSPLWREHCADLTAPQVQALVQAGAVILGKTNVSEMMLYLESDNPVYGCTHHPWREDRSPGGSSGGEAAIVAVGGSVMGLGSDLGGSIRVPAHVCGIHGFKPSAHRLSTVGMIGDRMAPGQENIVDQPGPLARHVDDLILMMQLLCEREHRVALDSDVPPLALEVPETLPAGLRLGYYYDDGFFPPSPAVVRVVRETVETLRQLGITMVPFQPPDVRRAMSSYFGILSADGGRWARHWLSGSGHDRRIADVARLARLPSWLRQALAQVLDGIGQRRSADAARCFGRSSMDRYWQLVAARRDYIQSFLGRMAAHNIQGIICPPSAQAAVTHGASYYLTSMASYSMLYNFLGLPAGTLAVSKVKESESGRRPASRDWVDRAAAEVDRQSTGLPLGVQIVGRPWQDGLVLKLMKCLEGKLKDRKDYPVWRGG